MSSTKHYRLIRKIVSAYRSKLNKISEDNFQQTPPEGGWSYSEVYFHIFDASILTLGEILSCIQGEGKIRSTPFLVKIILFFGRLPPGKKFKAPKQLAARLKKISKAEAENLITEFLNELEIINQSIGLANKGLKTLHPRMGYLNAFQWLRFAEIHLNHHFQQLKRIEKRFKI